MEVQLFQQMCDIMIEKDWIIEKPDEFLCEKDHYLIKGISYWRVTQVKSVLNNPGLNTWRAKVGYDVAAARMKEGANYGSKMHKLFEIKLEDKEVNPDNYDDTVKGDLESFDLIVLKCKIVAEALEQNLWSNTYMIAGTADFIGYYTSCIEFLPYEGRGKNRKHVEPKFPKKSHVIGDWKTSPSIYKEYWLQLAAYIVLFEELTGIRLDGAFIAQFKDGKVNIEEKTYDELMPQFEIIKHLIPLFEYTKGILPKVEL